MKSIGITNEANLLKSLCAVMCLSLLFTCSPNDSTDSVVEKVEISGSQVVPKYHEVQYTASVLLKDGKQDSSIPVNWASSRPDIATIDNSGKLLALKEGTTTITATARSVEGSFSVTISNNKVLEIQIELPEESVMTKTEELNATLKLESGLEVDAAPWIAWSSNGAFGTISSNRFFAIDSGHVQITAHVEDLTESKSMYINVWEEISIDPALAQAPSNAIVTIPVVIIRVLPTLNGIDIDPIQDAEYWGGGEISIANMKNRLLRFDKRVKFALEEGSKFRGYKNAHAVPYLGYRVVKYIDYYKPLPANFNIITKVEAGKNVYSPHFFMLWQMFGMSDLVENQGVKEVWIWINGTATPNYPSYDPNVHGNVTIVGGWESNMSGPHGDVSNSDRNPNDMPVYNKTYIVYQQNTRRTHAEAIHNHGHQLEAQLSHINYTVFWANFAGRGAETSAPYQRAGDTHFTPNSIQDYDYTNTNPVESDIEDWTPNASGQKKMVSSATWDGINYAWPEANNMEQKVESQWYIYWMQNMPGYQNSIPWSDTRVMRNWWEFTADWDGAKSAAKNLHQPN
jgi:hypothetical protein